MLAVSSGIELSTFKTEAASNKAGKMDDPGIGLVSVRELITGCSSGGRRNQNSNIQNGSREVREHGQRGAGGSTQEKRV